jgi:hypothetical protein
MIGADEWLHPLATGLKAQRPFRSGGKRALLELPQRVRGDIACPAAHSGL